MIFEVTNPDQAMDILKYIVEKDYDCETSECVYDMAVKQDAEHSFESIADLCEEGEDEDADIYYKYMRKNASKFKKYVVAKLIEDIEYYDQQDYDTFLFDSTIRHIRDYHTEEKKDRRHNKWMKITQ